MTPAEFNAALDRIGWGATALAKHLGRPRQTVAQWQIGRARMPDDVAAWVMRRVVDLDRDPAPVGR